MSLLLTMAVTVLALQEDAASVQRVAWPADASGEPVTSVWLERDVDSAPCELAVFAVGGELDIEMRLWPPDTETRDATPIAIDDDSGGGNTPFLILDVPKATRVRIEVRAKQPRAGTSIAVHWVLTTASESEARFAEAVQTTLAESQRLQASGQPDEARECLAAISSQVAELPVERADRSVRESLYSLGMAAYRLSDVETAFAAWEKLLRCNERVLPPWHPGRLTSMQNLAAVLKQRGDLQGARELEEQVLTARAASLPEDHADILTAEANLAATLLELGELDRTRRLEEHVLEVRERTLPEDDPVLQMIRLNHAATLKALQDLRGALALEQKVVASFERTLPQNHLNLHIARANLAGTLREMGEIRRSAEIYEAVVQGMEEQLPPDHPYLVTTRLNLADSWRALRRPAEAAEQQRAIVELWTKTLPPDHLRLQNARGYLAASLLQLGRAEEARDLLRQVLDVYERTIPEHHPDRLDADLWLAHVHLQLDDPLSSLMLTQRVVRIAEREHDPDHPLRLRALRELGDRLITAGDFLGAADALEWVVSRLVAQETLDVSALVLARSSLAHALKRLNRLERAARLERQNLELLSSRELDTPEKLPLTRVQLAGTLELAGDLPGARALIEQALVELEAKFGPDHPYLQGARVALAGVLELQGELEQAHALLVQASRQIEDIRDLTFDAIDVQIAARRATLTARQGELGTSLVHTENLVDLLESRLTRSGFLSPREREERVISHEAFVSVALALSTVSKDSKLQQGVFEMCEALRLTVNDVPKRSRHGDDPETRSLLERVDRLNRQISRAASEPTSEGRSLGELLRERESIQRELATSWPESDDDRFELEALQSALAPDQAYISVWRFRHQDYHATSGRDQPTEERYLAWIVRRDQPLSRVDLGEAGQIDTAIDAWREALFRERSRGLTAEGSRSREPELGLVVTERIWKPLQPHLEGTRRIRVAPAESLFLLPFEAMPLGEEGRVLGDHVRITRTGSSRELLQPRSAPLGPPSLLAVGGVSYDPKPVADPIVALRSLPTEASPYTWSFGRLPETRIEVLTIEEYFLDAFEAQGGRQPVVLTRRDATRERFERLAPRARYLHLATHGWFAPESIPSLAASDLPGRIGVAGLDWRERIAGLAPSLLCGLVFANANGPADGEGRVRGILTAEEIAGLNLTGCELAVLSACETAIGLRRGGHGIASLQRAFHQAGARTTITSLWKIPDGPTRELMGEFYRRLWILGQSKAEALWGAKKKLREQLDREGRPLYRTRDWAGWALSVR